MKPKREIEATLAISKKDTDFDAVTNLLEIEPTEKWVQKHEHLKNTELDYRSWNLSTGKLAYDSMSDVVEILLKRIEGKEGKIKTLIEQGHAVDMICSIVIWRDNPVYDLSREVVKKLAEIEAEFGIDLYDYSEDEEDDF